MLDVQLQTIATYFIGCSRSTIGSTSAPLVSSQTARCCPNLHGLISSQSGTTAGYYYSAANKNNAVNWEENTLYDYLLNPKKVILTDAGWSAWQTSKWTSTCNVQRQR